LFFLTDGFAMLVSYTFVQHQSVSYYCGHTDGGWFF